MGRSDGRNRPVRIVRCHGNVIGLAHGGDFPHFADAAAARDIGHYDIRRLAFENWPEHEQAVQSLAGA